MLREELEKLGPLSRNEKITAGGLGLTVALWIFGGQLGVNAVAAALLGLGILLITNVVGDSHECSYCCHDVICLWHACSFHAPPYVRQCTFAAHCVKKVLR